jgi:hypothetical protein
MRVLNPSQVRNWRERAEECRSLAESFHDEATRDALLKVADGYDQMANNAVCAVIKPPANRAS